MDFALSAMTVKSRGLDVHGGSLSGTQETKNPLIFPRKINGLANLVAGTGFEPVTFGL